MNHSKHAVPILATERGSATPGTELAEGSSGLPSAESPALMTMGDYYGSLAATRCLGTAGIPVVFAEHRRFVAARWSRYVKSRPECANPRDLTAFSAWLTKFGQHHPGHFLYATSDDLAYILASQKDRLAPSFHLYQPSVTVVMKLLDKRQLASEAAAVGLRTPQTVFFNGEHELQEAASKLSDAILIKPRTQVGLLTKGKGCFCASAADVPAAVAQFMATETYDPQILKAFPGVAFPMLQHYHASAVTGMLSISGFIAAGGAGHCMMAAVKVFQRPRRLGVGVAFEARPLPQDIADRLVALCERVGYFGVFEAEFILDPTSGQHLLVDFNPRYYGQMAFEIARGMRLPLLAYYGALGRTRDLAKELAAARDAMSRPVASHSKYALGWTLQTMLVTQRLGGQLPASEWQSWQQWLRAKDPPRFDAIKSSADWVPFLLELLHHFSHLLRHPRDFYRKFFRAS